MKKIIPFLLLPAFALQAQTAERSMATPPASFTAITWVPNTQGFLNSQTSPLQYHNNLDAVSLIVRKGPGYTAAPANNNGAVVAYRFFNGAWDSTCIWSSATNYAKVTQGGIYNPPGNNNINNAYVIGMGPTTTTSNVWNGNFYASKSLSGLGTNTPGADAQILYNNLPSYPLNQTRHHFSQNSFVSTDDGVVRSLAVLLNNPNSATMQPRGAAIVKGSFNAGAFSWSTDTLIPSLLAKTNGEKYMSTIPYQAWNEAGTVGYVMMLGIRSNASGSNKAMQPIVFKTTNSGVTWVPAPAIDFNSAAFLKILNRLAWNKGNTCLYRPHFKEDEGIACVVDNNDKLHIISTIASANTDQQDSLTELHQFTLQGKEYFWQFKPNTYPYIYDFYTNGATTWSVNVIDSLWTQGPGWKTSEPGYSSNPWDANPLNMNNKIPNGARIQAGRNADGKHILITYAESDTAFTWNQEKYNSIPNVFAKGIDVLANTVSEKINITKGPGNNIDVANRATLHYMSPSVITMTVMPGITFATPITVCNSNPYDHLGGNKIWYANAAVTFSNYTTAALESGTVCLVGVNEQKSNSSLGFELFPNPASAEALLRIHAEKAGQISCTVTDISGRQVYAEKLPVNAGNNQLVLPVSGLAKGLYLVSIEQGGVKQTQRLVKN